MSDTPAPAPTLALVKDASVEEEKNPAYLTSDFVTELTEGRITWTIDPYTITRYPSNLMDLYLSYVGITRQQYNADCARPRGLLRQIHACLFRVFQTRFDEAYYRGVDDRYTASH
jgi:hypothetical protein